MFGSWRAERGPQQADFRARRGTPRKLARKSVSVSVSVLWNLSYMQLHCIEYCNRVRQLYKNISMLFLFPVKDGKLSTGVNATFSTSCYG